MPRSWPAIASYCRTPRPVAGVRLGDRAMLGAIRQFADRVKRRERVALLLVGLCAAIGLAAGLTGRRAFLEQPCSTFQRPDSSESRCVDHIAVVASLDAAPPALPPPPLRFHLPIVPALEPDPDPLRGPLGWLLDAPPVSLRGPPAQAGLFTVVAALVPAKETSRVGT